MNGCFSSHLVLGSHRSASTHQYLLSRLLLQCRRSRIRNSNILQNNSSIHSHSMPGSITIIDSRRKQFSRDWWRIQYDSIMANFLFIDLCKLRTLAAFCCILVWERFWKTIVEASWNYDMRNFYHCCSCMYPYLCDIHFSQYCRTANQSN